MPKPVRKPRKTNPDRVDRVGRVSGKCRGEGDGGTAPHSSLPLSTRKSAAAIARRRDEELIRSVQRLIERYIVLDPPDALIVSAWVLGAWTTDAWDRFPHLAITSPEKRCGKTRFLQLLSLITPRALLTTNISPASLYRVMELKRPTLIIDEAQSIARRGSEASEVLRELLCAGIDRNSVTIRCTGKNFEPTAFHTYGPKVVALIGKVDNVVADRCLEIRMRRKTSADNVAPFRLRDIEPRAEEIRKALEQWADTNMEQLADRYTTTDYLPLENDRIAELMLPLQTVLGNSSHEQLKTLEAWARSVDQEQLTEDSPGLLLLRAANEWFDSPIGRNVDFMETRLFIEFLLDREDEPWLTINRGRAVNAEFIARNLRPYGITPDRKGKRRIRGYAFGLFVDSWSRYLGIVRHLRKTRSTRPPQPTRADSQTETETNSSLSAYLKGKRK